MRKYQTGTNSENILTNKSNKRQGDWVCMMCNNLNYSFRNTCNRCKNVTREQNTTMVKTHKERQPLGELPLNRHSSFKDQIHHSCLDEENYFFRSHTKKQIFAQAPSQITLNQFSLIETSAFSINQTQGFSSLLFLTPNRYMNVKEEDEKDQYSEQDSRSPCVLAALSPLLRALKDEINCQY